MCGRDEYDLNGDDRGIGLSFKSLSVLLQISGRGDCVGIILHKSKRIIL